MLYYRLARSLMYTASPHAARITYHAALSFMMAVFYFIWFPGLEAGGVAARENLLLKHEKCITLSFSSEQPVCEFEILLVGEKTE
jgi:hypothetical protein